METSDSTSPLRFYKVIACEIAARELYHAAASSPSLVDLEFLTQGYHDIPSTGRSEIQKRIDQVPAGKYDAILVVYGLCTNIVKGLSCPHTPLVLPRAHDCITFFLGSKERYQQCFSENPGTYYYTSGWLECAQRRGNKSMFLAGASVPASLNLNGNFETWAAKYGEDQARFLLEEMGRWSQHYTHGTLIQYEFLRHLDLQARVRGICQEKGWEFSELPADPAYFQKLLGGVWPDRDFLVVPPGGVVEPSGDEQVIQVGSHAQCGACSETKQ